MSEAFCACPVLARTHADLEAARACPLGVDPITLAQLERAVERYEARALDCGPVRGEEPEAL